RPLPPRHRRARAAREGAREHPLCPRGGRHRATDSQPGKERARQRHAGINMTSHPHFTADFTAEEIEQLAAIVLEQIVNAATDTSLGSARQRFDLVVRMIEATRRAVRDASDIAE